MRVDIPLADQIVQVGHACMEAGFRFRRPDQTTKLVVLALPSEIQLLASVEELRLHGIRLFVFEEPDDQMGFTAACTEPLASVYKREFRNFPIWKYQGR